MTKKYDIKCKELLNQSPKAVLTELENLETIFSDDPYDGLMLVLMGHGGKHIIFL